MASKTPGQLRLEGCWVLTFQTGLPQYFLLGFSPATVVSIEGDARVQSLQDAFASDTRLGLGTKFTREALNFISPGLIVPEYEVVFDRSMLAWTVNSLNGVTFRGEWLSGDMLLARYDAIPPDAPMDRLTFQADALQALVETVGAQDWSENAWRPYFNLGQRWKPDAESLFALTKTALPTAPQAEVYINVAPLAPEATPTP